MSDPEQQGFEQGIAAFTMRVIDLCIKHPWVVEQIKNQDVETTFSIDWKRLVDFIDRLITEVDKMKGVYAELEEAAQKGQDLPAPSEAEHAAYVKRLEEAIMVTRTLQANTVRSPRDPAKVEAPRWVFDLFTDKVSRIQEFKS